MQKHKIIHWLYRWLPVIFGCHQRTDRSFFYNEKQLPLCARCTGELIGILLSVFLFLFVRPHFFVCFLLCIPLVLDGFAQKLTAYESTNAMRLLTGILFGIGLVFVRPHFFVCFLLCIPLVLDGFAQKLTAYESTNAMRLLTGILFGIGLVGMFWSSTSFVYNKGYWFGLSFVQNYKAFPYL